MTRRRAVPVLRPQITWLLVAGQGRARVLQRIARPVSSPQIAAVPEPVPDMAWRQEERPFSLFASEIAAGLAQAHRKKRYDRLVLIAPHPVMAELKAAMPPAVIRGLAAEMPCVEAAYNLDKTA